MILRKAGLLKPKIKRITKAYARSSSTLRRAIKKYPGIVAGTERVAKRGTERRIVPAGTMISKSGVLKPIPTRIPRPNFEAYATRHSLNNETIEQILKAYQKAPRTTARMMEVSDEKQRRMRAGEDWTTIDYPDFDPQEFDFDEVPELRYYH